MGNFEGTVEETTKKKETGVSLAKILGYTIGSAALFAAAVAALPEVMPKVSGRINKELTKISNKKSDNDDNWGPVIEKK